EADLTLHINVPVLQCALKLQSAAAYVAQILAEQADHAILRHLCASLFHLLIVDQDFAGENQGLRTLAGSGETSIYEKFIDPNFQMKFFARSRTTKVPALAPVQSVEASLVESLTKILCPFSTEFSTNMLKTSGSGCAKREKSRPV